MRQHPDQHDPRHEGAGGIPDGLLVGVLGFLLGMTLMVWTATGLAGWFSRGAWPDAITFTRTPLAMRHLIGAPHDIPGAWPDTPAAQLSGYGLFWGLFIGQLMVLLVLAVFVMGTVARWRAGRARRRAGAGTAVPLDASDPSVPAARTEQPPRSPYPLETADTARRTAGSERAGLQAHEHVGDPAREHVREREREEAHGYPGGHPGSDSGGRTGAGDAVPSEAVMPQTATAARPKPAWTSTRAVVLAPAEIRHPTAAQAVRDAEGPALVITSDPRTWSGTKDARAKLGPVLLYDPVHLCDTPARLHWSPVAGCEDRETAAARAAALLAAVRPTAKADQAMADVAETLMRSYLHAAAVEGRAFRHVHRWAQGAQVQDAVRALRTNPKAASGAAGELEAALVSHPERRDIAQELTARALAAFGTVNIRESCTPNRNDSLALDSFVNEGGTLYLVGEPIEDPKANPGAMPLLTALASSVVERGRRMAERSSSGRLDPPFTLVLDDIAAVAPLPQLPELLSTGPARGLPTLALLRSREQLRARWPQYELPV
ncbi:type IV secretory system conjugative DNA transfer family protein [Streptomyces sp. NBC_00358]|uniref:type IV secretory system conjugative DNA transfer family protein n=1 Tax=Streptomyces sp. NBC_00358 TaxID=2975725 RepID=UPI002E26FB33